MKTKLSMILLALSLMAFSAQDGKVSGINAFSLANISSFEKLSPGQRQHLEVYKQIKILKINKQYSPKKCFEPQYKPFIEFISQLEPMVLNEAQKYDAMAQQFFAEGNKEMQAKATKRMNMCKTMAQLCKDAKEAYDDEKQHNKLVNFMGVYSNYEYAMAAEGIKLPKRNWLTPSEADLLITRLYRNMAAQKAKQKQQTGAK